MQYMMLLTDVYASFEGPHTMPNGGGPAVWAVMGYFSMKVHLLLGFMRRCGIGVPCVSCWIGSYTYQIEHRVCCIFPLRLD
jgi:hypothetical protein